MLDRRARAIDVGIRFQVRILNNKEEKEEGRKEINDEMHILKYYKLTIVVLMIIK